MTEPLVSIITPTYNHERYIATCISSVLAQSYGRWELLVVDDGSSDRTGEVARSFGDGRIRYRRQVHRGIHGLADTYNDALREARGDLIAILEGDDFWPPDKLETLIPQFDAPDVVFAYGLAQIARSDGTGTGETIPSRRALRRLSPGQLGNDPVGSAVRPMLLPDPGFFTYPCTLVLRRSALAALGGFLTVGDRHAVDWATCIHLALLGRFAFVPRVMGFWRRHGGAVNSSLRLEAHLREDFRFLRAFALAHQDRLGLTANDLAAMDRAWERFWSPLWRRQGRYFLLRREWEAARDRFRQALRSPDSVKGKLGSLVGVVASLAHRDIEWLWRLRNKSTLGEDP
jgi:glycosyltransferase involved in cell wall biosynthesis